MGAFVSGAVESVGHATFPVFVPPAYPSTFRNLWLPNTIANPDGDPIDTVPDLIGSYDMTAPGPTQRPAIQTDTLGRYLDYDGSNDSLAGPGNIDLTGGYTYVAIMRPKASKNYNNVLALGTTTVRGTLFGNATSQLTVQERVGTVSSFGTSGGELTAATDHLIMGAADTDSVMRLWIARTALGSFLAGPSGCLPTVPDVLYLGHSQTILTGWPNMRLYAAAVADPNLTPTQLTEIWDWANTEFPGIAP
jgi:hypothetical protein